MEALEINYRGKKARTGGICFNDKGHLQIFVAYCPHCYRKVTLERTEAEQFANKYCHERNKLKNKRLFRAIDSRRI